eukprot:Opistho-2@3627
MDASAPGGSAGPPPPRVLLGADGGRSIVERLSKGKPVPEIAAFQAEHGLNVPTAEPVLPLLDLHLLSRGDFACGLLGTLSLELIKRVESTGHARLRELLDATFPYVQHGELRPIVFSIMRRLPSAPVGMLEHLASRRDFWADSPIEVRRQIWELKPSLFHDEVFSILNAYANDPSIVRMGNEMTGLIVTPPKQRRESAHVQRLVTAIGKSFKLYNITLNVLRSIFARKGVSAYCSLRSELLMAFHDAGVQEIYSFDPCHAFTWCLDACVRDRTFDWRQLQKMEQILREYTEDNPIVGDLAMIICDPFVTNSLTMALFDALQVCVKKERMPAEDNRIMHMILLLSIGETAQAMLRDKQYALPSVSDNFVHHFLPALASMLVDDQLRPLGIHPRDTEGAMMQAVAAMRQARTAKLDSRHEWNKGEFESKYDFREPFMDNKDERKSIIRRGIADDPLARRLMYAYAFERVQHGDLYGLHLVLSPLRTDYADIANESPFLQTLVSIITQRKDKLPTLKFSETLVTSFFLPLAKQSDVAHREYVRLIAETHSKISNVDELKKILLHVAKFGKRDDRQGETCDIATAYKELIEERLKERLGDADKTKIMGLVAPSVADVQGDVEMTDAASTQ